MMARETLSVRQAELIIREYNRNMKNCSKEMEDNFDTFFIKMAETWADNNSINCAKEIARCYEEIIIADLNKLIHAFHSYIIETAKKYIRVGGMDTTIVDDGFNLNSKINPKRVKNYFGDGDDFGVIISGPEPMKKVVEDLQKLTKKIEQLANELQANLSKINAFGNQEIKLYLIKIAGSHSKYLIDTIQELESNVEKYITEVMTQYQAIAQSDEVSNLERINKVD